MERVFEVDNLRLILILLGLIILAAIVLFHRPKGQSQPNHARWRQDRREPSLGEVDSETESSDQGPDGNKSPRQPTFPALDREPGSGGPADPVRPRPTDSRAEDAEKIVTVYVRRRDERRIGGSDLLDAALKAGLTFGEMSIFHRRHEGADKPVFSMANLTPPGHFDASTWNVFDTPGVAIFATLPGPVSALDTWDAMLATARRIAELLDAEVLDDATCLLTRQRIAQIREEMREFDRQHGLASGG
ncbi:MAG: cell division protein ZipA [Wenzhouxiangella sp.]|nr:MAG: cell division protein ZipA [Wenzhouxiangella sp.]